MLVPLILFRLAVPSAQASATRSSSAAPAIDPVLLAAGAPTPAIWPDVFHMLSWSVSGRSEALGITHLYYDFKGGRNLNIITSQDLEAQGKGTLWDYERQDGLSFYYTPKTKECRTLDMEYGLLSPSWLADDPPAELIAEGQKLGIYTVNVWTKGESDKPGVPFITYYSEVGTGRPVRWVFFTRQVFDIIAYEPGVNLPEHDWKVPDYCSQTPPGAAAAAHRASNGTKGWAAVARALLAPGSRAPAQ
jgi:hypothetical protein